MNKRINTSIQDWAPDFMESSNDNDQLILPATISSIELAKYVSGIANDSGGNILLGAYSENGYGSEFQNVESELVHNSENLLKGVDLKISSHRARLQNIYLLEIKKSDSLAFADGSPYKLKNGKPILITERQIIEILGLGIDSSLINMISEQITKQSAKVEKLSEELKEKSKLKNQVSGLLVGGIIGWGLSTLLNILFGVGVQ
jgi:predicted HTH transcriptional regulator